MRTGIQKANLIIGLLVLAGVVALFVGGSLGSLYRNEIGPERSRSQGKTTSKRVSSREDDVSAPSPSEDTGVLQRKENDASPAVCPICDDPSHTTVEEHEALLRRLELERLFDPDPSPTREERIKRLQDEIRRKPECPEEWEESVQVHISGGIRREEIFTPEFVAELEKTEKEARKRQREWVALLVDPNAELPAYLRWPQFPQGLRFEQYSLPKDCVELLRPGWARVPDEERHFDRLSWIANLIMRFEGFEGVQFLVQELERLSGAVKLRVLLEGLSFYWVTKHCVIDGGGEDIPSPMYEAMRSVIRSAGRLMVFHPDSKVKKAAADALLSGWGDPLQRKIAQLHEWLEWTKRNAGPAFEADKRAHAQKVYAQKIKGLGEILQEVNQYARQAASLALSSGNMLERVDAATQLNIDDAAQRWLLIQSLDNGSLGAIGYAIVFTELVQRWGARKVWEYTDLRECLYRYVIAMSEGKEPKNPPVIKVLELFAAKCGDATAKQLLERFPKEPEEDLKDDESSEIE